ncbi:MAG: hypothetical protein AAFP78_08895, partial [Pseudomonadota bacterium]
MKPVVIGVSAIAALAIAAGLVAVSVDERPVAAQAMTSEKAARAKTHSPIQPPITLSLPAAPSITNPLVTR